jgi:DNA repair protein RadC
MAARGDNGTESVDTLLALQAQWHDALAGRLEEYAGAAEPGGEAEAVRAAYRDTVREHLAARIVLDEFAKHPVLALPRRWEHVMLADAAHLREGFTRARDAAAAGAMLVADLHPDPAEHHSGHRRRRLTGRGRPRLRRPGRDDGSS